MTENKDLIIRIVKLPVQFNSPSNTHSIYYLLKETGYFNSYDKVTINFLKEVLLEYSEFIKPWQTWAENKRSAEGWYFDQNQSGKYIIGYYSRQKKTKQKEYSEIEEACATFIKKEIEDIRKS